MPCPGRPASCACPTTSPGVPPYQYDLADRRDRRDAYQRVMTEGLAEDVLHFIDVDQVVDLWDELYLSPHVREPWERWLRARGLLD